MTDDLIAFLESYGGRHTGRGEYVMDCPFCNKAGHMYVGTEPKEREGKELAPGRWCCFRCGQRGLNPAKLMAELQGGSIADARKLVSTWKMGSRSIQWKRSAFRAAAIARLSKPMEEELGTDVDNWLPAEFEPVYDGKKWLWPKYLTDRRIPRELGVEFNLGVVRRHDRCELCEPKKWCPNDFKHRIIMPVECPIGRSFTARSMLKDEKLRYKAGPDAGRLLYGWNTIERAAKQGKIELAVVVEGPFDALAVAATGLPVVAIMGLNLRDTQVELIKNAPVKQWVAMLDEEALAESADLANRVCATVAMGLGRKDPGDSTPDQILGAIRNAVEPSVAREIATNNRLNKLGFLER